MVDLGLSGHETERLRFSSAFPPRCVFSLSHPVSVSTPHWVKRQRIAFFKGKTNVVTYL